MEISNSKHKTWRSCPQKGYYKYVEKLKPKLKAKPLRLGTMVHECLEDYYNGIDYTPRFEQYRKEWAGMFEEEREFYKVNLPEVVENIVPRYIKYWKERDKNVKIIAVEQDFKVHIPGTKLVYTGKIDRIEERDIGVFMVDLKTMSRMPKEDFRVMDTQSGNYMWVYSLICEHLGLQKDDLKGFIYDYIRTKTPVVPDVLKCGDLSQRKNMDTDYDTYLQAIIDNGLNPEDYEDYLNGLKYKAKKFFIRKAISKSNYLLRNVFNDLVLLGTAIQEETIPIFRNIGMDCDRCEYRDLCLADLTGKDREYIINTQYEKTKKVIDTEEEEEETEDGE